MVGKLCPSLPASPSPSPSRAKLQFNAKINCSVGAGQLKLQSQLESVLESQLELELELELELTNRQQAELAAPMIIGHLLAPFSALKGKRIQKYLQVVQLYLPKVSAAQSISCILK